MKSIRDVVILSLSKDPDAIFLLAKPSKNKRILSSYGSIYFEWILRQAQDNVFRDCVLKLRYILALYFYVAIGNHTP
jgi:hypothetical protein